MAKLEWKQQTIITNKTDNLKGFNFSFQNYFFLDLNLINKQFKLFNPICQQNF